MKKISILKNLTTLLISLCFSIGSITAQITIKSSDLPSKNDTVRLSTGLNVDFIDYTETGENFTWDFSGLFPIKQTVDTFLNYLNTPFGFLFWGTANIAKHQPTAIPVPGLSISNIYDYYKNSGSSYKYVGYIAMLNGIPLPLKYSSPDVLYKFPLNYTNSDSSSSGTSIGITNLGYFQIQRHRKNIVDGWGTLITPYGSFEVLRVKSQVTEFDSIYIDSLNTGIPINRNYTEYKWLGKNMKEPLLEVVSSYFGVVATYIDSARNTLIGIDKHKTPNTTVRVYPNPSKGNFYLSFDKLPAGKLALKIFSTGGKTVFSKDFPSGSKTMFFSINNTKLKPGNYFLNIRWQNHLTIKKLMIMR